MNSPLTCMPGIIHYNDAKIQPLDHLPGVVEGATEGKDASKYDIDHLDHSLLMDIKYLLLYGVISSKHKLQQCSTEHLLHDEGVVQIVAKEKEEDRGQGLIQRHTLQGLLN
ncbi:unnamed protein product [Sphagnum troendelagicum]|uniref:Uncharacterized protein n=1 Tax=Sphagnum troendelagicum TaxID=128251 RepID=A0ABP0THG1_9BRYO